MSELSMSEPEIARRCSHCGVTLRESALFCPQCGQEISADKGDASQVSDLWLINLRLAELFAALRTEQRVLAERDSAVGTASGICGL